MSANNCPRCKAPVVSPYLWKYGCGTTLDGTASELCEARAELETLRGRVRELEGLEITRAEHFAQGTIVSFHLARVVDLKSKTLGEAMPTKKGGQS